MENNKKYYPVIKPKQLSQQHSPQVALCMYKKHKQYRLPNFDYAANGYYFITIVTYRREHQFGNIKDQVMYPSAIGEFVQQNIISFCPVDNIENPYEKNPYFIKNARTIFSITEWEVLPNHIHLIVEIINNTERDFNPAQGLSPLAKGSVSLFINHFKGHITKHCKNNNSKDFKWQSKFHDRIIRNNLEYQNIAAYINANIANWEKDDLRNYL